MRTSVPTCTAGNFDVWSPTATKVSTSFTSAAPQGGSTWETLGNKHITGAELLDHGKTNKKHYELYHNKKAEI